MNVSIIIGCGGTGSNLAYLLSRDRSVKAMVLVDFDVVEQKNLERQFFTTLDIGKKKCIALKESIEQLNPEVDVSARDIKITNSFDIESIVNSAGLNYTYDLVDTINLYVCTDNEVSKGLISDYVNNCSCNRIFKVLFVGCDEGIVNISRKFNANIVWSIGEGYNSTQNFDANMDSAIMARKIMKMMNEGLRLSFPIIIHNKRLEELLSNNELKLKDDEEEES